MKREELISEITDFCFKYRLFNKSVYMSEIKDKIEKGLNESDFIESLINTIIYKTRNQKNIDTEKLKKLLLELEKIRLELEYANKST